jgi:probable DNA metabolism protein
MHIRHEATFDGLLTAIAVCMRAGQTPEVLFPDLDQLSLFICVDIVSESGIRALFQRYLCQLMGMEKGQSVFDNAFAAYLSDDEGIGLPIYHYLSAAIHLKDDPAGNLLDRDIDRVVSTAKRVRSQAHAFLGLIRFRQMSPTLYLADFTPDYHILPLILPHFCERLPDQQFVIRDLRRDLAAVHVPGRAPKIFVLVPPDLQTSEFGSTDQFAEVPSTFVQTGLMFSVRQQEISDAVPDTIDPFIHLWRRYLSVLTIPERRNLKLQRSNMPKKYWKYLSEQPG